MAIAASNVDRQPNPHDQRVWEMVANNPVRNLWNVKGVSPFAVARCVRNSTIEDRLFGQSAELAFYFLFSLFPTLLCASSILGLAAQSAHQIYNRLLDYLSLVLPTSALGTVLTTFNETTAASTSGKITFGLVAAIWSASVGISACQETLNAVYRVAERRSYLKARLHAIALTIILVVTVSLCLSSMLAGDVGALWIRNHIHEVVVRDSLSILVTLGGWVLATAFLALSFAVTYFAAPDLRNRQWHWITPGTAIGMAGWLLASLGFRVYLHFFNTYSVTYGSLGAVIILLMWFYITGLMLLLGAEINSEIEAAAAEAKLAAVSQSVLSEPSRRPNLSEVRLDRFVDP
jgi:membrane protein